MIIPEYKALFVHVPKAAGQSVEDFLLGSLNKTRKLDGKDYLLRPNSDPTRGPKRLAHLTASEYVSYDYLTAEEFKAYFTFSIVRNPWSRIVSFYKFRGFSSLISFNSFVKYYLPKYFEEQHWFFKPQADFIYDTNDQLLVDFLGRLENLNKDFSAVAERLSIPFTKLPKNNHSVEKGLFSRKSFNLLQKHPELFTQLKFSSENHKKYQDYYTDSSVKIVDRLYEKDIDLLEYTF